MLPTHSAELALALGLIGSMEKGNIFTHAILVIVEIKLMLKTGDFTPLTHVTKVIPELVFRGRTTHYIR